MSWFSDLLDKLFAKKEIAPSVDNLTTYMPIEQARKELGLPPQPILKEVPPAPDMICKIEGRPIYKSNEVVYWTSDMQIDADGCPRAYHPKNIGLDWLANAGKPGDWYGLVTDDGKKTGNPIVQGLADPAPGYYMTETAYGDITKKRIDPTRYVDSQYVPYIAVPPILEEHGVKLGDLCMVFYKDKKCAAVVADIGPHANIGEGSMALATALGINASPKHGGVNSGVTFYIMCDTYKPWPRTAEDIKTAEQLFEAKNVKI